MDTFLPDHSSRAQGRALEWGMGGAEQKTRVSLVTQLLAPADQRRLQAPLAWGGPLASVLEVGTCPFWGPPRGGHPPSRVLFSLTKMLFQLVWVGKRLGSQYRACPNSKEMSVNAFGANWPEWWQAPIGVRKARPGRHGHHPPTHSFSSSVQRTDDSRGRAPQGQFSCTQMARRPHTCSPSVTKVGTKMKRQRYIC